MAAGGLGRRASSSGEADAPLAAGGLGFDPRGLAEGPSGARVVDRLAALEQGVDAEGVLGVAAAVAQLFGVLVFELLGREAGDEPVGAALDRAADALVADGLVWNRLAADVQRGDAGTKAGG